MNTKEAVAAILAELKRAKQLHERFPHDPVHAVAIMAEEAGEAIQRSLDVTYAPGGMLYIQELEDELIQTAAMCVRCLINLHNFVPRKAYKGGEDHI